MFTERNAWFGLHLHCSVTAVTKFNTANGILHGILLLLQRCAHVFQSKLFLIVKLNYENPIFVRAYTQHSAPYIEQHIQLKVVFAIL